MRIVKLLLISILPSFFLFSLPTISNKTFASIPASNHLWTTTLSYTGWGSDTDSEGNVYVTVGYSTLANNNKVAKYNSSGVFVSERASYGTGQAQFKQPHDVAVDTSGNIYIADYGNHRIQKLNSSYGWIWTRGGTSSGSTNGMFYLPEGVAVNSSLGLVYVSDTRNHRIQILDAATGVYVDQFGSLGTAQGQFNLPKGIAVDSSGNIYVADSENNRIQVFDSNKTFLRQYGGTFGATVGNFKKPSGVSVDADGNVYVADSDNYRIQKISSTGNFYNPFGSMGTAAGQFNKPYGVAVDSSGNVFVSETTNKRIQKFSYSTALVYQLSNVHSSLEITDVLTGYNIEDTSYLGVNNSNANLRIKTTTGIPIADATVDMTVDRDWTGVTGDSNPLSSKSYITNLAGAPGVASGHTLYVPIPLHSSSDFVYICPHANSLEDVSFSCTDGISRRVGTYNESFGDLTITQVNNFGDDVTYWKISGITGSGGITEVLEFSGSGTGTVENPYKIANCTQLSEMRSDFNAHYELISDIDCTDTTTWNLGAGFIPVGTLLDPFTGSLDGNSFTISNLFIDKFVSNPEDEYVGLFGYVDGATISDVNLVNIDYKALWYFGGLVGYMSNGTVTNVTVSGTMQDVKTYLSGGYSSEAVGGVIGMAEGSNIENSSSSVNIDMGTNSYFVGGFIGNATSSTEIDTCYATGYVYTGPWAYKTGGFVGGLLGNSTIRNSYATGQVHAGKYDGYNSGLAKYIGGFAGTIGGVYESTAGNVYNSYSTGTLISSGSNDYIGGFVGWNLHGGIIADSYSTKSITLGEYDEYIGGFAGSIEGYNGLSPSVYRSYATGNITSNALTYIGYVGGFVGAMDNGSPYVEDCYSSGNISINSWMDEAWFIGGFVGQVGRYTTEPTITIKRSFAKGNVYASSPSGIMGGFAGIIRGYTTIDQCASYGYASGGSDIGGFSGVINIKQGVTLTISNSYSRGNATGTSGNRLGGFVGAILWEGVASGSISSIINSYSTGSVTAGASSGGFIGVNNGLATLTSSYWDTQTSGMATSAGGTGYTTAQMKDPANFTGWNFTDTWFNNSSINNGYHYLIFSEPTLNNLTLSAGLLDQAFEKNTYSYTSTVSTNNTTFTPTTSALVTSSIEVLSTADKLVSGQPSPSYHLPLGLSNFDIRVTSYDSRAVQTYSIGITRDGDASPPNVPSNISQFKSDGITAIEMGTSTDEDSVILGVSMTDPDASDILRAEFEVISTESSFTNTATHTSSQVNYSGTAVTGAVTLSSLSNGLSYHWQVRVCDADDLCSSWASYGNNLENEPDFTITLATPSEENETPSLPTNLLQYKSNGTTLIPTGGSTDETSVVLKMNMSDPNTQDTLTPQFEVRVLGVSFGNTPTHVGTPISYTGTPVIGQALVSGLSNTFSYQWQGRVCDSESLCSAWVAYAFNVGESDFNITLITQPEEEEETPTPTISPSPVVVSPSFQEDDDGIVDEDIEEEEETEKEVIPFIPIVDDEDIAGDSFFSRLIYGFSNLIGRLFDALVSTAVNPPVASTIAVGSFSLILVSYLINVLKISKNSSVYNLQLISSIFAFKKLKKKTQNYGLVYDSVTKEPINRAVVRIFDNNWRLITTEVTDVYGIFDTKLPTGTYKFVVDVNGYRFPSRLVQGSDDEPYMNIYKGDILTYSSDDILNISIPMDRENEDLVKESSTYLKTLLSATWDLLLYIFFIFGFTLTLINIFRDPNLLVWIVFILYMFVILGYIIFKLNSIKKYGVVRNMSESFVYGLELGLIEQEFGKLFSKRITDEKGRYRFIVPEGSYKLVILNTDYKLMGLQYETFEVKKGSVYIVKEDIFVKKV